MFLLPSFRAKYGGVPPPPFLSKSIFKTLVFFVNDFWGYPSKSLSRWVRSSDFFGIWKKLKWFLLGKGGTRRWAERSCFLYVHRETYVVFSIFIVKCLLFSGSLESSRVLFWAINRLSKDYGTHLDHPKGAYISARANRAEIKQAFQLQSQYISAASFRDFFILFVVNQIFAREKGTVVRVCKF